jgi:hypothetical protein
MRRMIHASVLHMTAFVMLAFTPFCSAQTERSNVDSGYTVTAAEMRASREAFVRSAMDFSSKEAAAFWPIYWQYESERSTLDECRATVVKEYAEKYLTLSNENAMAMADKIFDCDSRLTAVKKKYFKKFSKVLPAYTVTKFFQVEHRVDLVMEMRIQASLLPRAQAQYATEVK